MLCRKIFPESMQKKGWKKGRIKQTFPGEKRWIFFFFPAEYLFILGMDLIGMIIFYEI